MKMTEISVIWNQDWKLPGESLASILLKASYANSLNSSQLKDKVGKQGNIPSYGGDFLGYSVDLTKISNWLGISKGDLEVARLAIFLSALGWSPVCSKRLRYCPTCLSYGYHSSYFQITALTTCPIHELKLKETCPHCNSHTSFFGLCEELFEYPYFCSKCGGLLSDKLPSIRRFFSNPDAAAWGRVWQPLEKWVKQIASLPLSFSSLRVWVGGYGQDYVERQIDALHILDIFKPLPSGLSWRSPSVSYRSFRYLESSYRLTRSYRVGDTPDLLYGLFYHGRNIEHRPFQYSRFFGDNIFHGDLSQTSFKITRHLNFESLPLR